MSIIIQFRHINSNTSILWFVDMSHVWKNSKHILLYAIIKIFNTSRRECSTSSNRPQCKLTALFTSIQFKRKRSTAQLAVNLGLVIKKISPIIYTYAQYIKEFEKCHNLISKTTII